LSTSVINKKQNLIVTSYSFLLSFN